MANQYNQNWRDYYSGDAGKASGYIGMLEGYAKNYMNPNSPYNQGMYNRLNQSGQEYAGQLFNQGSRMQAAGQNPFANSQYRQQLGAGRENAYQANIQRDAQNQQLGQGMLGMGMQARMQQSQQAQQQAQSDREYKQHQTGQWLALGGTLLGAGISGPLASMLQKPAQINNNMPEQASPYALSMGPTAGPIQNYLNKANINPNDVNDATGESYQTLLNLYGQPALNEWYDKSLQGGTIEPQSSVPSWIQDRWDALPTDGGAQTTTPSKAVTAQAITSNPWNEWAATAKLSGANTMSYEKALYYWKKYNKDWWSAGKRPDWYKGD